MQHEIHAHPLQDSGNFVGHAIPGTMLLAWAICWLVEIVRARDSRAADAPLETLPFVVGLKLVLPLVGVAIEWPGRGWSEHTRVMNFEHVSMYAFFATGGLVDLLHRRGVLPRGATYAAFAAAAANAGALFLAHGSDGGVSNTVHLLLAATFLAAALAGLGEWLRPDLELAWLRTGAMLVLGSWFWQIAWLLFRSGRDLSDPLEQMRAQLLFSWHVLAAGLMLLGARVALARAAARAPGRAQRVPVAAPGEAAGLGPAAPPTGSERLV